MTATVTPINWRMLAACAKADPDLFFGFDGEPDDLRDQREAKAKAVCVTCPVSGNCLMDALDGGIAWGVFGGLGEQERAEIRRSGQAAS
jgi:WhiB family redox-sensing transcriptional regulator